MRQISSIPSWETLFFLGDNDFMIRIETGDRTKAARISTEFHVPKWRLNNKIFKIFQHTGLEAHFRIVLITDVFCGFFFRKEHSYGFFRRKEKYRKVWEPGASHWVPCSINIRCAMGLSGRNEHKSEALASRNGASCGCGTWKCDDEVMDSRAIREKSWKIIEIIMMVISCYFYDCVSCCSTYCCCY